jgi:signal recognition particle subunit SRP68
MHAILLPTPSYPSAIQLTNQASTYIGQSRASLFPSGPESAEDPIQEPVRSVKISDLDSLQADLGNLENAAKRAWFGQVVNKPLFYDTAFNYVDLPLEELERIAGRGSATQTPVNAIPLASVAEKVSQPVIAAAQSVTEKLPAVVADALPASVKASRESRGREATPALEEEPAAAEKEQPKSSGWFGGLWGGKK